MGTGRAGIQGNRFYRDFNFRFRRMAFRFTKNDSTAEDLAQDISLKIHQNLSSYRTEIGSLENWAMRLGRNLIIDYYRSAKRCPEILMPDQNVPLKNCASRSSTDPYKRLLRLEAREILERAFKRLPEKLGQAVRLRDVDGLTYQEISHQLEVPEGTAKSRINRGRKQLEKLLTPHRAVLQI